MGFSSVSALLREVLSEQNGAKAKEMARKAVEMACEGNATLFREIIARVDGPLPMTVKQVEQMPDDELLKEALAILASHGVKPGALE
ncbi:MAG: hypothetical protein MUC92_04600 [Fimbriimonadaceae bacterium]|jgi:hypothetical protein|nr:hypothetical protein [Fimbriimonadaceae bacterium]